MNNKILLIVMLVITTANITGCAKRKGYEEDKRIYQQAIASNVLTVEEFKIPSVGINPFSGTTQTVFKIHRTYSLKETQRWTKYKEACLEALKKDNTTDKEIIEMSQFCIGIATHNDPTGRPEVFRGGSRFGGDWEPNWKRYVIKFLKKRQDNLEVSGESNEVDYNVVSLDSSFLEINYKRYLADALDKEEKRLKKEREDAKWHEQYDM